MNIFEIIKGNLPEGAALTDKDLSAIAAKIKEEQGKEFLPKEQYSKKIKELADAETKITDLEAKVTDFDAVKKQLKDEQTAHVATKTAHEAEKVLSARSALAEKKLIEAGCNPAAVRLILKELPLDKLTDDGSNFDELHKPIREANAALYGTVTQKGAEVVTPPAQTAGAPDPFLDGFNTK